MAQGKSAMMISRPWDWPSLIKSGIDLGLTLVHGINGKLGKAFMGVQVDISQSLLAESRPHKRIPGEKGLSASDHVTPSGIPAMISLYDELSRNNPLLGQMKRCVNEGEVMPNIPQMGIFWRGMAAAVRSHFGRRSTRNAQRDSGREAVDDDRPLIQKEILASDHDYANWLISSCANAGHSPVLKAVRIQPPLSPQ